MPGSLRTPLDLLGVFKTTTRERFDWITPLAMAALFAVAVGGLGHGRPKPRLFFIASGRTRTSRTSLPKRSSIGTTHDGYAPG